MKHTKKYKILQYHNTAFLKHCLRYCCSAALLSSLQAPEGHCTRLYPLNDLKAIQTEISRQGLTRIKVQDDRIRHVFGVTGEYVLETDEEQGQIFVRPVGEGSLNPISLTLTTERGHTQDLLLKPTDKTPEALVLKADPSSEQHQELASFPKRGEIEDLIQACREGRIPVGYKLMPIDLKTVHHHLSREISNGSLRGLTYEIRNTSREPLILREEDFAESPQTIAVFFTKRTLNPGERTYVYVVKQAHP